MNAWVKERPKLKLFQNGKLLSVIDNQSRHSPVTATHKVSLQKELSFVQLAELKWNHLENYTIGRLVGFKHNEKNKGWAWCLPSAELETSDMPGLGTTQSPGTQARLPRCHWFDPGSILSFIHLVNIYWLSTANKESYTRQQHRRTPRLLALLDH